MSAVPKMADKKSLRNLVPLNGLSATHFDELARKATILELKAGKYLFKKGERDNSTCFVLSGEVALMDGSDIKLTIQGGTEEAKHPIAPQQPRQLSARAKTAATIISIDSGLLDVMLAWEQSASYEVADIEADDEEDWMTRMMQSDLLQRLPATNLQQLFMRMEEVETKAGEVIVNQDEEGDYYYIIKQGTCIVSRKASANGRAIKLAELNNGDSFGEESLLSGGKRNATVTMLTPGVLMRLSKDDFNELLKAPLLNMVEYDAAKKMVADGAVYLDVRLPGEHENAHLGDSMNIPLAAIRNEMTNIDKDKTYVVYCDTGRRSTSAVFLLGQFGVDAYVLKDGLSSVPMAEYADERAAEQKGADVIDINRDKGASSEELAKMEQTVKLLTDEVAELKSALGDAKDAVEEKALEIGQLKDMAKEEKAQLSKLTKEAQSRSHNESDISQMKLELSKLEEALMQSQEKASAAEEQDGSLKKQLREQSVALEKTDRQLQDALAQAKEHEGANEKNIKELEAARQSIESLKSEKQQLSDNVESLQREKEAMSKDIDGSLVSLKSELDTLRKQLEDEQSKKLQVEKDLHDEREQSIDLRKQLEKLQSLEQDLASGQKEADALRQQLTEHEEQEKSLSASIDEQDKQLTSLKKSKEQLEKEKTGLVTELEVFKQKLESQSESTQQNVTSLEQQLVDLKNVRQQMQSELDAAAGRVAEMEEQIFQLEAREKSGSEESQNEINRLTGELNKQQQSVTELKESLKQRDEQLQSSESTQAGIKAENEALQQQQQELTKELQSLKDSLTQEGENIEKQITDLQRQLGESASAKQGLADKIAALTHENEELRAKHQHMQTGQASANAEIEQELEQLKAELEQSQTRLQSADQDLKAKENEDGEVRKELAALRAVYAQKETELGNLQQSHDALEAKVNEYQQQGSESSQVSKELQIELDALRKEYEQVAKESNERIHELEGAAQKQEQQLSDSKQKLNELKALKNDAESSYGVIESELNELREEREKLQAGLAEKESKMSELEVELEKLRTEQQDWRVKENDAAQGVELEFSKSRIGELETQLRDSQQGMAEARDAIEELEKELSMARHATDSGDVQGQIEQLKREMESQLDKYKQEVDGESGKLQQENEQLRDELKKLYDEQDLAIETGSPVKSKPAKEQQPEPQPQADTRDHSELFNLPDTDKNLFSRNAEVAKPKGGGFGKMLFMALLFSALSAGGVYWYFVMHKGAGNQQPNQAAESTDIKAVEPKAVNKPAAKKAADSKKSTSSKKPLFNFKQSSSKKKAVSKSKTSKGMKPTRVYRDFLASGGSGPVMVGVPSGTFKMGSPSSSVQFEERPQHAVSLKRFSISKYEVTFADYDKFAAATGRPRPSDNGWGRNKRPVVNVSWNDAVAYTKWLSKQTGYKYRLPTEAEWEYAARAGTKTKYWWGSKAGKKKANCFNCGSKWDRVSSAPVGSFAASTLALHDMTGNVMEWVSDCYHANYNGAPVDGSSWQKAACKTYVVRGGSYRSTADNIRITKRSEYSSNTALDQIGFRVVRER